MVWFRSFWFLFLVANAIGASIMRVDMLPSWQGTGIACWLIFAASVGFGFFTPPRAWLHALAVGGWISALGLANGNPPALFALVVGLGGAAVGAYARHLFASMAEPS
jgi:hypothetical protein